MDKEILKNDELKILIVDDQLEWREIAERHLSEFTPNAKLSFASSFNQAIGLINQQFFHAAILDLRLEHENQNNQDGLGILKHLHDLDEPRRAIMLSGFGTPERILKAWDDYKALGFIQKENFEEKKLEKLLIKAVANSLSFLDKSLEIQSDFNRISMASTSLREKVDVLTKEESAYLSQIWRSLAIKHAPYKLQAKQNLFNFNLNDSFLFSFNIWSRKNGCAYKVNIGRTSCISRLLNIDETIDETDSEENQIQKGLFLSTKGNITLSTEKQENISFQSFMNSAVDLNNSIPIIE